MHGEDRRAALLVGQLEADRAVEAALAQQRGIEHVGTVRRADDDDALRRREAVDLGQQLVERLALLLGGALAAGAAAGAAAAERVELVDEDDRRRGLARASLNRSRTRRAPTPTYISTKSEPEIE